MAVTQSHSQSLAIHSAAIRYAPDGMALHQYLSERFEDVEWKPIQKPKNIHFCLASDILLLLAGATIKEGVQLLSKVLRDWLKKNDNIKSIEILDCDGNVLRTVKRLRKK